MCYFCVSILLYLFNGKVYSRVSFLLWKAYHCAFNSVIGVFLFVPTWMNYIIFRLQFFTEIFVVILMNVGVRLKVMSRLDMWQIVFVGPQSSSSSRFFKFCPTCLHVSCSYWNCTKYNSGFCTYYCDFQHCWGMCLMIVEIGEVWKVG